MYKYFVKIINLLLYNRLDEPQEAIIEQDSAYCISYV